VSFHDWSFAFAEERKGNMFPGWEGVGKSLLFLKGRLRPKEVLLTSFKCIEGEGGVGRGDVYNARYMKRYRDV